jgi:hypothetical protein
MNKQICRMVFVAALGFGAMASPTFAQNAATPADPAFEAAKQAFEALPIEERMAIQRSLVWTVPFNGAALGTFGNLTFKGIKAFEKRAKTAEEGILDEAERETLMAQAAKAQAGVKFKLLTDKKSGSQIGLAQSVFTKKEETPVGAKWQNGDGSAQVDLAIGTGAADDLPTAFDRFLALPDRKITYKLLRPDFFVITGENGTDSFYIRFAANGSAMRGFTFRYPTAKQKQFERYVIAAANTFVPFPDAVSEPVDEGAVLAVEKPRERFSTALALADGRILTASQAMKGCKSTSLAGKPAKTNGEADGVAVFAAGAAGNGLMARKSAAETGEAVLALSTDDKGAVSVSPGTLVMANGRLMVETALLASGSGAAIVDRKGQVLGIVTSDAASIKPVAGIMPVSRHAFTAIAGGEGEATAVISAGAIAASAAPAILPLSCAL